jgi:hypothetical protein
MKLFVLYSLFYFVCSYRLRTLCKNCNFFIPSFYGARYELQEYYGKCGKFIKITNGEIEYEYAYKIRQQEENCGENARYFMKRNLSIPFNGVELE